MSRRIRFIGKTSSPSVGGGPENRCAAVYPQSAAAVHDAVRHRGGIYASWCFFR
jgi:hypothetical protein